MYLDGNKNCVGSFHLSAGGETLNKAGSDWMFLAEHADEFDPTLPACLRSLTFHRMLVLQRRYLSIPPSARLFPIALTAQ
ncbi:hypothetical protein JOQ06_008331 [Pogonophryne albipinna]|uniref:Uncharacterized protein n=1 Tax=Pogonophryne albipinna TaxID=1090488 RepID=A0AAD6AJB7_9TELE|nr:hypothetical protein JOQ06_008331 [Pogonophryne albipinna]